MRGANSAVVLVVTSILCLCRVCYIRSWPKRVGLVCLSQSSLKRRKKERKKKLQRPRRGCVKVVSCKSCFFFSFFVLSFFSPLTSIITTEGNEPGLATGVFLHLPLEVALAQLVVRGCDRLQSMLDQQSSAALSTVQFSLPTQPIRNHCGKP